MNFDRAALKLEVRNDLRETQPKAIWVTLAYLALTYVITFALELIQGLSASDPMAAFTQFQDLMMAVEYGWLDEEELLQELLPLYSQFGSAASTGILFGIINSIISWTLGFGYQGYCLGMVRREDPGFSRLACAFPQWGWVLLTGFLVGLFTGLWALLFFLLAAVVIVLAVVLLDGSSLAVTLSIVAWGAALAGVVAVSLRYAMANYILLDEKVDALEAISRSKAMMRGRKGHLFILDLSFFGWYLLLGLIVSIVVSVGMVISAGAAAYNINDPFGMMAALAGGAGISGLVAQVVSLPLMIWLTPYRAGAEAKFYDWMKQTDQEHGVWEGGRGYHEAPSIPQYEQPYPDGQSQRQPPQAPEAPRSPEPPFDAPDRPNYE